jgi:sodium-dependent dicarboxylate transporter 2/3/5
VNVPFLRPFVPWKFGGFVAGVAAFLAIVHLDGPLQRVGAYGDRPALAAGVAALMAIWWLTEALPIYATACVPLVLFPFLDPFGKPLGERLKETGLPYVNDYVMLFAGGMCVGAAMQHSGLDRRIALAIMRGVGAAPKRLLLGVLSATAFISLWISNTATAAMMFPIGMAVLRQLERRAGVPRLAGYGAALMLSIAYGANIGGIGTKIGTAPNGQFCGMLQKMGHEVTFLEFAAVGFPFVLLMIPIAWWMLWRVGRADAPNDDSGGSVIAEESAKLGRMSSAEWISLTVFVGAAALWIVGKTAVERVGVSLGSDWLKGLKSSQVEGYVALLAAAALLVSRPGGKALLGKEALLGVPWETLVLLGGSFAMAAGIEKSGLSAWLATHLVAMKEMSGFAQVLATSFATVGITAVASNTATVSVMLPLLKNAATQSHVITVLFASTISSSCDFALPAGTPPNAIVFGSGYLTIPRMAKTGVVLDVVAALVCALWVSLAVPLVFG